MSCHFYANLHGGVLCLLGAALTGQIVYDIIPYHGFVGAKARQAASKEELCRIFRWRKKRLT